MKMSARQMGWVALAAAWWGGAATGMAAQNMPEFGGSVEFDQSGPSLKLSKLKGKAVLVVFFQSWCPICNEWAPNLIRQVQEAHGNNRGLVLVAMKTDGGGTSGAKDYLKSKGADLNKWIVAHDKGAAYYNLVTGQTGLWGYTLVGAEGQIVQQGKAGMFYKSGPTGQTFTLAGNGLLKGCGRLRTVLPADKKYPDSVAGIARLAEMGQFGQSLKMCGSPAYLMKDKAAVEGLKQDIVASVEARIAEMKRIVEDEKAASWSRYESARDLLALAADVPTVAAAREAQGVAAKALQSPAILREKQAEEEYGRVSAKLKTTSAADKSRVAKELRAVAEKYKDTKYGNLAATEAAAGS